MGKGHNEGGQEEHNSPGAESPWARRLTSWGAEKAQQCHKYFLQYSTFAWGPNGAQNRGFMGRKIEVRAQNRGSLNCT